MKALFRELTADEIAFVAGGDPGDIVVVGNPWGGWGGGGGGGGGGGYGTSGNNGGDPPPDSPTPPDCHFNPNQDTSQMTPEQRQQYDRDYRDMLIDHAAAQVRAEILAMPDQRSEYGAILYRDSSGTIQHSPLRPSSQANANIDYSVLPIQADGTYDYSNVVGLIHSHPDELPDGHGGYTDYWFEGMAAPADYLTIPSQNRIENGSIIGDWISFQSLANDVLHDNPGGVAELRQYIAGFNGTTLGLNDYSGNDYNTSTAKGELDPTTGDSPC